MDTGKAIFFGLALIAVAIFATDGMRPANAGLFSDGWYMGVNNSSGRGFWMVDSETGAYALCRAAKCHPWKESRQ